MGDRAALIAKNVVSSILDRGLAESTWRDKHEIAYQDLVHGYRRDIEQDASKVIRRALKTTPADGTEGE